MLNLKKLWIFLFFSVLFVVGIFVTKDYGIHCDQKSELDILYSNVREYNQQLFYNNKTITNICDSYEESEGRKILPISLSVEKDHGVSPYYIIAPFLLLFQNDASTVIQIQHYYNFLLFFVCVIALYFLAKKITKSRLVGIILASILYSTPRFFAEAHYNNKDILLFAMFVISITCGYQFIEKSKVSTMVLFSFSAAICANIKIVGILPFGIVLFIYMVQIFIDKQEQKRRIVLGVLSLFLFLGFLIALTPAMWSGWLDYGKYLLNNAAHFSRWDNWLLFDGNMYRQSVTGIPRRYILVEYLITTPIYILALSVAGTIWLAIDFIKNPKEFIKSKGNCFCFLLIAMGISFFVYAVLSHMVVYNGWRHLYFTYIASLCAILFLAKKIYNTKIRKVQIGMLLLVSVCILFSVVGEIKNHPYQYTYFNALAGKNISERYEIDYWCVSTYNALMELDAIEKGDDITITSLEYVTWTQLKSTLKIVPLDYSNIVVEDREDGWVNAEYILDNPMYSNMYYSGEYEYIRENYKLVVELKAYGNDILRIYEKIE